ncbi:MAG: hypothetical protein J7K23_01255 [Thermoproteales archaeon]|nr:hypothetical protein [Thermoproteales archaeon]
MIEHDIEKIFYNCKKILRILKVFFEENEPLTIYRIEKNGMIYDINRAINKLIEIGIVKKIDEEPNLYILNEENSLVPKIREFLKDIGYIS